MRAMAFLAPLAAEAGAGLFARIGASIMGRVAGSAAADAAGGGAAESSVGKMMKPPGIPMPNLGSNGGSNNSGGGTPTSVLNADQFR